METQEQQLCQKVPTCDQQVTAVDVCVGRGGGGGKARRETDDMKRWAEAGKLQSLFPKPCAVADSTIISCML